MCHYTATPYPYTTRNIVNSNYTVEKVTPTSIECIICLEKKKYDSSSHTPNCLHSSCKNCLRDYFNKVLEGPPRSNYDTIPCPQTNCQNQFQTSDLLPKIFSIKDARAWWESADKKAFLINKVTCPFKNCAVSYDVDEDLLKECTFTKCLMCHKGFCTACQTVWHPGAMKVINEKEHTKKTLEVAKNKEWTRCPQCKRFVEKIDGCTSMICVCGTSFCYRCGGLQSGHTCINRCQNFNEKQLQQARKDMFTDYSDKK